MHVRHAPTPFSSLSRSSLTSQFPHFLSGYFRYIPNSPDMIFSERKSSARHSSVICIKTELLKTVYALNQSPATLNHADLECVFNYTQLTWGLCTAVFDAEDGLS